MQVNTNILDKKLFMSTYKNLKLGNYSLQKYSYWFPLKPSSALARIVGDISSDGHLRERAIHFIAKDKKEVYKFQKRILNLFFVQSKIRRTPANGNIWECLVMNQPLCRVLTLCGVPKGDKTLTEFLVPNWIINGDESVQSAFLQGLYDGDGSVFLKEKGRVCIALKFHKYKNLNENMIQFFEQIRLMLINFGIKTTNTSVSKGNIRKDGKETLSYLIHIYGTRRNPISIINFYNRINFGIERKSKRLSNLIRLLKTPLE